MPRVYPYGIVLNTILHSIIIHSIGVHNETANQSNLHDADFWQSATSKVIKIHPFGTIDVELSNGKCFRITGLSLT